MDRGARLGRLSHAQRQFWTGQQLHPGVPLYNMALAYTIDGRLDPQLLAQAFRDVVQSTDALRTVFVPSGNEVERVVLDTVAFETAVVDLRDITAPSHRGSDDETGPRDEQAALDAFLRARAGQIFDTSARCFDSVIVRCSPETHVWLLTQHHLITDATACTLVYRAVVDRYLELERGVSAPVEPAPSYELLLDHEASDAAAMARARAADHWAQRWDAPLGRSPIYGSAPSRSTASTRVTRRLGQQRTAKITEAVSARLVPGLTSDLATFNLLATLLASWASRVSGDTRIAIGFFSHNRPRRELKHVAGVFVELVPVVCDVEPADDFVTIARSVASETMQSLRHAVVGGSESRFGRDLNLILNVITAHQPTFGDRSVRTEWVHGGHSDIGHDVRAQFYDFDGSGDLTVALDFNDETFSARQRDFAVEHFLRLLDGFLDDPHRALAEIDIVGDEERAMLEQHASWTPAPSPSWVPVVDQIEAVARRFPGRVACRDDEQQLTYGELDRLANGLASRIIEALDDPPGSTAGLDDGGLVAMTLTRSVDFVVTVLAAHKAGVAYMPIDPKDPRDRRRSMVDQSGARAVVAHEATASEAAELGVPVVRADKRVERTSSPERTLAPHQLAYVLGTSGTTGRPKLIEVDHDNLRWLVDNVSASFFDPPADSHPLEVAVVAPFVFDPSVQQTFTALAGGHTLHVLSDATRTDGERLRTYLADHRIDVSDGTPAHLRLLLDGSVGDLCALRVHFLLSGDVLARPLARRFLEATAQSSVRLSNLYGVAECAVVTTHWPVDLGAIEQRSTVPIGRPLPETAAVVVDDNQRLQPFRVAGEVLLGGRCVGRGYRSNDALTAEKFVTRRQSNGARWYRTGDVARMSDDGVIEFIQRSGSLVKVQGHRIELGEVESALRNHRAPAQVVLDAAATVVDADDGVSQLHAYYVAAEPLSVDELRAGLAQALPAYMIPSRFFQIDEIPLNRNGKVDRQALRPDRSRPELETSFAAPRRPIEADLATIWCDVLDLEHVGVHDNFFAIGGDSIRALDVVHEAGQRGLAVRTADIFSAPTIAGLAERLGDGDSDVDTTQAPAPTARRDPDQAPPLSDGERSLLFEQMRNADEPILNIARIFHVDGRIDPARLEVALRTAADGHEPLRWTFGHRRRKLDLSEAIELQIEPQRSAGSPKVDRLLRDVQRRPFDLRNGPLLRCLHQPLDDGRSIIMLALHHVSADHRSLIVLWESVADAYEGRSVAAPEIGVADLTEWQALRSPADQRFWATKAFGPPQRVLDPRTDADGYLERRCGLAAADVRNSSRYTSFTTALTSAAVASRALFVDGDEIELGLVASTRDHARARRLIGYLLNVVPICVPIDSDAPLRAVADQVAETTATALEHRTYPFARIVDDKNRAGSNAPSARVLVSIADEPPLTIDGFEVRHEAGFNGHAVADMTFFMLVRTDEIRLGVEYSGTVGRDRAAQALEAFDAAIMALHTNPEIAADGIGATPPVLPSNQQAPVGGRTRSWRARLEQGREIGRRSMTRLAQRREQ